MESLRVAVRARGGHRRFVAGIRRLHAELGTEVDLTHLFIRQHFGR